MGERVKAKMYAKIGSIGEMSNPVNKYRELEVDIVYTRYLPRKEYEEFIRTFLRDKFWLIEYGDTRVSGTHQKVVDIRCEGYDKIGVLVATEGYTYARYVGIPVWA